MDNNTLAMLNDVAVCINEEPADLITAWNLLKAVGRLNYRHIKELQESGIPVIEGLSELLNVKKLELLITAKAVGIEFNYFEQCMFKMVAPGGKFHLQKV